MLLRSERNFDVPELDAFHRGVELRGAGFRIAYLENKNVLSDYGLLQYSSPFIHRMQRSAITIVLDGAARFEEDGKRVWLDSNAMFTSNQMRGGTEGFAPLEGSARSTLLTMEWEPDVFGLSFDNFEALRLPPADIARLRHLAYELVGRTPLPAILAIFDVLRSIGVSITNTKSFCAGDLIDRTRTEDDQRLLSAIDAQLSCLELHPSIEEVADDLGWSTRHTNRRLATIAERHGLAWSQWRAMLHATRMLNAFRLLSAPNPNTTTELVAKKTGFRSPAALCHALTKAGLPSPGVLARACRGGGALGAWTSIIDRGARAA